MRFENGIENGKEVVIITTKGEAVAIAVAEMTSSTLASCDHGIVCKTKRVIMDRETYPRKWGLGPYAVKKQKLIKEGKLDKYGKPNEKTPEDYKKIFGKNELKEENNDEEEKEEKKEKKEKKEEKLLNKKTKKEDSDSDSDSEEVKPKKIEIKSRKCAIYEGNTTVYA